MINCCVYCHINKTNGKRYVGQTSKALKTRFRDGLGYKRCTLFYRAIQKYGWDNFEHKVLIHGLTKEQANRWEKRLIKEWDLMNPRKGYNLNEGGIDGKHCTETIKKIAEKNKNRIVSEKTKSILKIKCSGWHHTEEAKRKISEASKINLAKPEVKEKIIKSLTGRPCSQETRNKISIAQKGRKQHPNTIKSHLKLIECINTGEVMYSFEFANKYNLKTKNIGNSCRLGTTTQGYSFKYVGA